MTPQPPAPQWYNVPPERYSGSVVVNIASSSPSTADLVDLGGGDYSLDVTDFGAGDNLVITIPPSDDIQVVAATPLISFGGVAVRVHESTEKAGGYIGDMGSGVLVVGSGGEVGVCAVIVDGKVYARIALHTSSFSVDDCFDLPLPLYAYVEGGNIEPISIGSGKAGWDLFPSLSRVRIAGYNLPTNLEYLAGGESPLSLTADGGDYGIEFTQPAGADSVIVFDAGFWLYVGGL